MKPSQLIKRYFHNTIVFLDVVSTRLRFIYIHSTSDR